MMLGTPGHTETGGGETDSQLGQLNYVLAGISEQDSLVV